MSLCPCGSNHNYQDCCQPLHLKQRVAETAEKLMRSRYCAFVKAEYQYLIDTHASEFASGLTKEQLSENPANWVGLQVESAIERADTAKVTFKAWYQIDCGFDAIYECSDFIKRDGIWLYTRGEQFEAKLPKRNDMCICNSGKKFKKCCALTL
ncbi:hypothetical protein G3R49_18690 [Shewanella sp. WXL01]|uniref:YchJ family protein n=1 Tax=Shewanella sp. WXL01 TaxID=2709721 RepID=UPI0014386605|nr:YchJ family metal-binding protein [Shewanella sp. WXL01]NKF52589.1 hypothetical protein [Shewanella sp. WXL01]